MQFLTPEQYEEILEIARFMDEHFEEVRWLGSIAMAKPIRTMKTTVYPKGLQKMAGDYDYWEGFPHPEHLANPDVSDFWDLSGIPEEVFEEVFCGLENGSDLCQFLGDHTPALGGARLWDSKHYPAVREAYYEHVYKRMVEDKVVYHQMLAFMPTVYLKTKAAFWEEECEALYTACESGSIRTYLTENILLNNWDGEFESHVKKVYNYLNRELNAHNPQDFGDIRSLMQEKGSKKQFRRVMAALSAYPDEADLHARVLPYVKNIMDTKWEPHHRTLNTAKMNLDLAQELALEVDLTCDALYKAFEEGRLPEATQKIWFRDTGSELITYDSNQLFQEEMPGAYPNLKEIVFRKVRGMQNLPGWLETAAPNLERVTGVIWDRFRCSNEIEEMFPALFPDQTEEEES